MKHDALLRVTESLRDRLQSALESRQIPGSVFVGPLDDADSAGAPLILFLYRIVPNPSLRNRERRIESQIGTKVEVFQNALPLDLHFLVTVGTTPGASEEALLSALGLAMQALQFNPDLTGPNLNYETVRVSLEPLATEEASRIWSLFPTANYRTSIAYIASPVWLDPQEPEPTAVPVTQDQLMSGSKTSGVPV